MKKQELINKVNKYGNKEYVSRLYTCNASIFKGVNSNNYVLKSYNTFVALYKKSSGTVFCFDYYSATTQQHFNKFIKWLEENGELVMRKTYLYKRSDRYIEIAHKDRCNSYRLTSKLWQYTYNNDFDLYIPDITL